MTLRDFVAQATRELQHAGIRVNEAALDAELLARDVLAWDRATWLLRREEAPPDDFTRRYAALVSRRATREPLAYIRGVQEFWGRAFHVAPGVLIPRPETELLVEETLALTAADTALEVFDIGTGSGCLAITLALERPLARVRASDISQTALDIATHNARTHGAAVDFKHGSLLAGANGPYDVIVSNPPYVAERERSELAPEVLREPATALFAGADGLRDILQILEISARALKPGGRLLMEIGYGQDVALATAVACQTGVRLRRIVPDLQGIPRVAVVERLSDSG